MGFWQTHESFAHPGMERRQEHDRQSQSAGRAVAAQAKALFTAPPDQGYAIHAEITKDGEITMTNDRNGYSARPIR